MRKVNLPKALAQYVRRTGHMVRLEWSIPGLEVRDIIETDDPESIEQWMFAQGRSLDDSLSNYLFDSGQDYDDDEAFCAADGEFWSSDGHRRYRLTIFDVDEGDYITPEQLGL